MPTININADELTYEELKSFYQSYQDYDVVIDSSIFEQINESTACVEAIVENDQTVYGINTGFGLLASKKIPANELKALQRSLVLSHACGVGDLLDHATVALIMVLIVESLTRGFSGIRLSVVQTLIEMINTGVYPAIPAKGSVGASGDLAPLAHLACTLIGEGKAVYRGELMSSEAALSHAGIDKVELGPKEGLALLNGTNVSTALAMEGLFCAENCLINGMITGSMTVEAALGSYVPFDERIHAIRGHKGQQDVAASYRELLAHSEINDSHANCDRVQDPYSLRCQPQVMGACLDHIRYAANTIITEANAVSDNPLVFAESGDILSGGNFHAEPIAMAADTLAVAMSEIGAIAERRISLLLDKHLSNLPPFLIENSGVNSGFMIAQVTAAALASENKSLAHPASVDSLPTSANQEDHVSMATFAARRLGDIADNILGILAIEAMCAAQGIDFRSPLKSSEPLQAVMKTLRSKVPFYEEDRYMADDIEKTKQLLAKGELIKSAKISPIL